jgi:serine protease Do
MHQKRRNYRAAFLLWIAVCCVSFVADGSTLPQAQSSNAKRGHAIQPDRQKGLQPGGQVDALKELNSSLERLVAKVSPAVVEVLVTGFGPVEDSKGDKTAIVGPQSILGSGVIVDPAGYIITNAHVVANARSIEVALTATRPDESEDPADGKTRYTAHLVGIHKDTDLALLKIDVTGLPYLPLNPKRAIHQGQLVLALGNPEGLGNSVTMGVISAIDRQPDPRLPMVFIQTDAPINPGNSGGPLIDMDGYLLGINTFILSEGGGSEGLGFAIPAGVVSFVFDKLRRFGHVDRSEIGAESEAITPLLAKGLGLPVKSGVIIDDVKPGGPAEAAGIKIGDIVLAIDGKQIRSLPQLAGSLYLHPTDEPMTVYVLRGTEKITFHVPVAPQKHDMDRLLDIVDPKKNIVPRMGILAIDVDDHVLGMLPDLRIKSGAVVVADTAYSRMGDFGLRPGDVIHAVNNKPISKLSDLQREIAAFDSGAAVVLQVERSEGMDYVAFEIE